MISKKKNYVVVLLGSNIVALDLNSQKSDSLLCMVGKTC